MRDYVNHKNPYRRISRPANSPLPRKLVHKRDNWVCAYCGKKGATIDHIIPKNKGGLESWDNVITACEKCNGTKGGKEAVKLSQVAHDSESAVYLSMWKENRFRINNHLHQHWGDFRWIECQHFYHIGGRESHRHPMIEVIATNQ